MVPEHKTSQVAAIIALFQTETDPSGHYCRVLTAPRFPITVARGVFALGEAKRKLDVWWIGSLVLVAISVLGLVYTFCTNSKSH